MNPDLPGQSSRHEDDTRPGESRNADGDDLNVLPGRTRDAGAFRALAIGALAIGALAFGALALGALAIGRLAVGSLAIGKSRIRRLEIEELDVKRMRVGDLEIVEQGHAPDRQ